MENGGRILMRKGTCCVMSGNVSESRKGPRKDAREDTKSGAAMIY